MGKLKELRVEKKMTQQEVAELVGISLRSYKSYEKDVAKEKETPTSDVDLLISTNVKGLRFYDLVEELRVILRKKVDVLDTSQLSDK